MLNQEYNEIISRFESTDADNRVEAVRALAKFQGARVLDLLLNAAISDHSKAVRDEARIVFDNLGKLSEHKYYLLHTITNTDSVPMKELISEFLRREKNIEKLNVLVAEDERDTRELICFTIQFAGWSALGVQDGVEAYAYTRSCKPEMVLMDVRMPQMTGYDACRLIKSDRTISHIPVVFLSAKGQEGEIQTGLEVGAEEYWLKPFAPDQLTDSIKSVMQKIHLGIYND